MHGRSIRARAAARLAAAPGLTPVDRLRLVEILLGPDAALALAEGAGPVH